MEDKAAILEKLHETLLLTEAGKDIVCLALDKDQRFVEITYADGSGEAVYVYGDSGLTLIRNVCLGIRYRRRAQKPQEGGGENDTERPGKCGPNQR